MKRRAFLSQHRLRDAAGASKSTAPSGPLAWLAALALALGLTASVLADSGADIYKARCSACHGRTGAGDSMLGRNLKIRSLGSDEVQRHSDDELANIIAKGKNRMPSFDRKLSKEQIREVVRHIRSLKK